MQMTSKEREESLKLKLKLCWINFLEIIRARIKRFQTFVLSLLLLSPSLSASGLRVYVPFGPDLPTYYTTSLFLPGRNYIYSLSKNNNNLF